MCIPGSLTLKRLLWKELTSRLPCLSFSWSVNSLSLSLLQQGTRHKVVNIFLSYSADTSINSWRARSTLSNEVSSSLLSYREHVIWIMAWGLWGGLLRNLAPSVVLLFGRVQYKKGRGLYTWLCWPGVNWRKKWERKRENKTDWEEVNGVQTVVSKQSDWLPRSPAINIPEPGRIFLNFRALEYVNGRFWTAWN